MARVVELGNLPGVLEMSAGSRLSWWTMLLESIYTHEVMHIPPPHYLQVAMFILCTA